MTVSFLIGTYMFSDNKMIIAGESSFGSSTYCFINYTLVMEWNYRMIIIRLAIIIKKKLITNAAAVPP